MTYALIENGTVIRRNITKPTHPRVSFGKNTTDAEYAEWGFYKQLGTRPETGKWQTVTGPHQDPEVIDHDAKTVTRVWSVRDWTVDEVKTDLLAQNHQQFLKARDKGVMVGGVLVGTSPDQQSQISTLVAGFKGKPEGTAQRIATASGFVGYIDAATAKAFQDAQAAYLSQVWETDANHIQDISDATTIAQLELIDINAGWPE